MYGDEFIDAVRNVQGTTSLPVRVVDSKGNILDIESVTFSGLNGGEIHIAVEAPDEDE